MGKREGWANANSEMTTHSYRLILSLHINVTIDDLINLHLYVQLNV